MAVYHFPLCLLSSILISFASTLRCNWEGDRGMSHQASVYDIRTLKEPESRERSRTWSPSTSFSHFMAQTTWPPSQSTGGVAEAYSSTQRTIRILFPKKPSSPFSKHLSDALTCQKLEHVFLKPPSLGPKWRIRETGCYHPPTSFGW